MEASRIFVLLVWIVAALSFGCTTTEVPLSKEANVAEQQDPTKEALRPTGSETQNASALKLFVATPREAVKLIKPPPSGDYAGHAVTAVFAGLQTAFEAQDVDRIMAVYSDDYGEPSGTGKPGIRTFFEGLAARGFLRDTRVGMEQCEFSVDGDSATAGPVVYTSPKSRTKYHYRLKREADGSWRIVNSETVYDDFDPFYNIQEDLLRGPDLGVFLEKSEKARDWKWEELAVQHVGDTPFVILARRDDVWVGWLRFYDAGSVLHAYGGDSTVVEEWRSRPPAGKALVVGAAVATSFYGGPRVTEASSRGTVRQLIEEAVGQAKRLGLTQVYAVASPDIRAYAEWCNCFVLRDYTACGFEVLDQTDSDASVLHDMAHGSHGENIQASVSEDGITSVPLPSDVYTRSYSLVRKKW